MTIQNVAGAVSGMSSHGRESEHLSGMRVLKLICVVFGLLSLSSLIPGIYSFYSIHFAVVNVNHGRLDQILSLFNALLFAMGCYGIHRRSSIAWKLGWCFFGVFLLEWLASSLVSTLTLPHPNSWVASSAIVVGGLGVTAYWGFWWVHQKSYFDRWLSIANGNVAKSGIVDFDRATFYS